MSASAGEFTNLRVTAARHAELKIAAAVKGKKIFAYTDELLAFALSYGRGEKKEPEPEEEELKPEEVYVLPPGVDIVL